MPPSDAVQFVAEYAKSKMSSCKKCSQFIEAKSLRLGLISRERGFDMTKWYHFDCFSEKIESTEEIIGFDSLKANDQEALKKLISGVKGVVEGNPNSASKSMDENEDESKMEEETSNKKKRTHATGEEHKNTAMPPSKAGEILAEYAKSKRSSCKKCSQFIEAKTLRLGLVSRERGFDMTKWYHLDCFSEKVESTEEIIGFDSLKENDQEALKKLISGVKNAVEGSPNSAPKSADENDESELEQETSKKKKRTHEIGDEHKNPAMPPSKEGEILAEYAKSKRSSCKKCSQFIEAKTLRLGLVSRERGFDMTKWHHLDCFSEKVESTEEIIGFDSLKENDQEALKKLVTGFERHSV